MVMKAIVVKGLASCHSCDKEDGDSKNGDKDDDRNAGNDTNNYLGYEGFCDRHLVSIGVAQLMTSVNLCMESFSLCSVSDDNAEDDNMSCNDGDGGDDTEGRTIDFGI